MPLFLSFLIDFTNFSRLVGEDSCLAFMYQKSSVIRALSHDLTTFLQQVSPTSLSPLTLRS